MTTNKVFLNFFSVLILSVFTSIGFTQANETNFAEVAAAKPSGRYCGAVFQNDKMENAEVVLNETKDGRLIGKMLYHDVDTLTEGTLEEPTKENGTLRTLMWRDKYGTGLVIFQFDDKFEKFDGYWGTNLEVPSNPWRGKRCDDVTT